MEQKYKVNIPTIKELMQNIKNGNYIIPVYQREFVWEGSKIIELLISISKGYPIGVITDVQITNNSLLANGRNQIFESLMKSKSSIDKAVVDGQQRLTSLAIAYYAFDMKELVKEFTDKKQAASVKKAINDIFLYENNFYTEKELKEYFDEQNIDEQTDDYCISSPEINKIVRDKIDDYELPIIRLVTKTDNEVIEVFTAMNKGGKPLTHVELMNGSMFNINNDFDLIKYINETNKEISSFGTIKKEFFVQLMKIYFDISEFKKVDYKKDSLISFSMDRPSVKKFISSKKKFIETLKKSIGILKNEFGIYSESLLPKNVYLSVVFAYEALCKLNNKRDQKILKNIIRRVSSRMLEGVYASSPGARTIEDINEFLLPMFDGEEISNNAKEFNIRWNDEKISNELWSKINELTYKNRTQGVAKLIISILYRNNPMYILQRKQVPIIESVGVKVKNDLHHFIPKRSKMAKKFNLTNPVVSWNIDKITNLAVITADENRNEIRSKDIQEYLHQSEEILGNELFIKMIGSHMFNLEDINNLMKWEDDEENWRDLQTLIEKMLENRANKIVTALMNTFFSIEKK